MTERQDDSCIDTYPEFMPWWTKAKEKYGKRMPSMVTMDGEEHSLTSSSFCFLGEVYGWSNVWQRESRLWFKKQTICEDCYNFGMNEFVDVEFMSVKEFYGWKTKVYDHIKQHHPKLLKDRIK